MRLNMDGGVFLRLTGFLLILILLSCLMFIQIGQVQRSLDDIPQQMDKVVAVLDLNRNLIAQSYCVENYIRYREVDYIKEFRRYSGISRDQLQGLHQVVRQSRKSLIEKILNLQQEYTQICENEIFPLVRRGEINGAERIVRNNKAELILAEMLSLNEELKEMRLKDTYLIANQTSSQARRSLIWGSTLAIIIILAGLLGSIMLNKKVILNNLIYRLILLNTRNAIIVIRRDGRIYSVNRVAENIFGFRQKDLMGRRFAEVFTNRSSPGEIAFTFPVEEVLATAEDICNMEMLYVDAVGWHFTLLVDCLQLSDESGVAEGVMLIIRDITDRKLLEEKLRGMAVRDSMTMLYNHYHLKQALDLEIKIAEMQGSNLAYNDTLGHPAGDEALIKIARLLEKNIRGSDIAGRYGGDEFAVILPGADHSTALAVGERLRSAMAECDFHHREIMPSGKITVSIGVAFFPDDAKDAVRLIEMADEAMYNAKRNAKNKVEVYFSAFKALQRDWPNEQDMLYNIRGLLAMVNSKDRYTYGHSEKVAHYATALARAAGLSEKEVKEIRVAAFLHDIGKVDIPEGILNKPGPLNKEELLLVQRHSETGAGIVGQIKSLEDIVLAIIYHHERYDGKGYPHRLAGEAIPLSARIISLADSFDAMTSNRPYRRAMSPEEACEEIKKGSGHQFDPHLAMLFTRLNREAALAASEMN